MHQRICIWWAYLIVQSIKRETTAPMTLMVLRINELEDVTVNSERESENQRSELVPSVSQ